MSILDVVGIEVLPVVGLKQEAVFSPQFGILFLRADLGAEEVQVKIDRALAASIAYIQ